MKRPSPQLNGPIKALHVDTTCPLGRKSINNTTGGETSNVNNYKIQLVSQ